MPYKQIPTLTSSVSPLSQARCRGLGHCVTRCLKGMAGKLSVVKGRFTSAPFSTSSCRHTYRHVWLSHWVTGLMLCIHLSCVLSNSTHCACMQVKFVSMMVWQTGNWQRLCLSSMLQMQAQQLLLAGKQLQGIPFSCQLRANTCIAMHLGISGV